MSDKLAPSQRHTVTLQDRPIYQWYQTLTSVDLFIPIPPGVKAKQLFVDIARQNIKFGITPNPPYMDSPLYSEVVVSESTWLIEDGELHIYLQKATQGEHWKGAIAGHELSDENSEEDRKRILLERFQLEHPGMDFSGAEMGGSVPDASTFLGGFAKQ